MGLINYNSYLGRRHCLRISRLHCLNNFKIAGEEVLALKL